MGQWMETPRFFPFPRFLGKRWTDLFLPFSLSKYQNKIESIFLSPDSFSLFSSIQNPRFWMPSSFRLQVWTLSTSCFFQVCLLAFRLLCIFLSSFFFSRKKKVRGWRKQERMGLNVAPHVLLAFFHMGNIVLTWLLDLALLSSLGHWIVL